MAYDLIKISALPAATPDESQEIVVGVGDYAKRINYGDVKADMVGTAPSYTTDTKPYLMRQTAHTGVVGKCALNKLVGGSLGWNQLVKNGDFAENTQEWRANASTISWENKSMKVTIAGAWNNDGRQSCVIMAGHKYLLSFKAKVSQGLNGVMGVIFGQVGGSIITSAPLATTFQSVSGIIAPTTTTDTIRFSNGVNGSNYVGESYNVTDANIHDLTLALGSTIADYIYNLETATAGAGIAKLKSWGIDLDTYHAYDAGSIQSVEATAHVTKDANDNVIGNYPLGSDTLRGIPQLVNNELVYDGDIKTPDGTITRNYGIVDLGTLNWYYAGGKKFFYVNLTDGKANAKNVIAGYTNIGRATDVYMGTASDYVYGYAEVNGQLQIKLKNSAYTDAAAFKTAMSGVYLVYEKVTPTIESGTPFQRIQTVDADGTESFTTSTPVPVGHETATPDNILAALEWIGE